MEPDMQSFDPIYEDTLTVEKKLSGYSLQEVLFGEEEKAELHSATWNNVTFDFEVKRLVGAKEEHKDLQMLIYCNRKAMDPHWRCAFSATVQCYLQPFGVSKMAEQEMTATSKNVVMTVPLLRVPWREESSVWFNIIIRLTSWSGIYSRLRHAFDTKTPFTDATLLIQGTSFYVVRSILAMHSTYFSNVFFNRSYSDAAKEVYTFDDIAPEMFTIFLRLLYPREPDDETIKLDGPGVLQLEEVEELLILAERFGCDTVKRNMEMLLMKYPSFHLPQRLLVADRYRLSAVCSHFMQKMNVATELGELVRISSEFEEMSEDLRAVILGMRAKAQPKMQPQSTRDNDPVLVRPGSSQALPSAAPSYSAPVAGGLRMMDVLPLHSAAPVARPGASIADQDALDSPAVMRISARIAERRATGSSRATASAARTSARAVNETSRAPTPRDSAHWEHFRDHRRRLASAASSFALSSQLASELDSAVQFLEALTIEDFHQLGSDAMRTVGVYMDNLLRIPGDGASTTGAVRRLLGEVDALRTLLRRNSNIAPPSKRTRKG